MNTLLKYIYEHLKTRKKYNSLMLKYDIKQDELDKKIIELNTQMKINKIERDKFEKAIDELTQRLVREKEKNKK